MKKTKKRARPPQKGKRQKAGRPAVEPQALRQTTVLGGDMTAGATMTAVMGSVIDELLTDVDDDYLAERFAHYSEIKIGGIVSMSFDRMLVADNIEPEKPWVEMQQAPRSAKKGTQGDMNGV